MKTASAGLIALLDSQTFLMADLLTITLLNGTVLRYCTWDSDLVVSSQTYLSNDIQFKRGTVRNVIGIEVDSMSLTLYATPSNMIGGDTAFNQIRSGTLDGARVKIDRLFMATAGDTSAGTVSIFSGRISGCDVGRSEAAVTVVSDLILLNIRMPRNVYQPSCMHTLYDDDMLAQGNSAIGCTLNKVAFAGSSLVNAAFSTTTVLGTYLTGVIDGYYDLGYLVMTSGVNIGIKRTIKSQVGGTLALSNPLPNLCGNLDTFAIYPGCDHLQSTCLNKFNNLTHFRGFPYVPTPETAV